MVIIIIVIIIVVVVVIVVVVAVVHEESQRILNKRLEVKLETLIREREDWGELG